MANTTFSGPVRSENGFADISKNATTGTITTVRNVTVSSPMTAGTGITTGTGTVYNDFVEKTEVNGVTYFYTRIFIDVTGLRSEATDGDIIGVDGGTANCHLGQVTAANNGTIYAGAMTCLELPAGGDPNIMLYSATEATGAENAAITGLTETALYDKNADWAANDTAALTTEPVADQYLYLVQGDATGTDATYTGGQFLIELYGYSVG